MKIENWKVLRLISIALLIIAIDIILINSSFDNDIKELKEEIKDIKNDIKLEDIKCQIKR